MIFDGSKIADSEWSYFLISVNREITNNNKKKESLKAISFPCELKLKSGTTKSRTKSETYLNDSDFFLSFCFEIYEIKLFDFFVPNLAVDYVHHLIIFQFLSLKVWFRFFYRRFENFDWHHKIEGRKKEFIWFLIGRYEKIWKKEKYKRKIKEEIKQQNTQNRYCVNNKIQQLNKT